RLEIPRAEYRRGGGEARLVPRVGCSHDSPAGVAALLEARGVRSAWIVGLLSVSIGAACNAATVSPSAAVEAPPSTPAIHEERDVAAPRPSPPSAGTVTSDRPPARVELPGAGGFRFEITTAAEYALYVRAAGGSASISLHRDETLLEQVYSVDGVNTDRFLRFLTPGTYALRLTERQARPLQVTAELRQLEPLPSAGS